MSVSVATFRSTFPEFTGELRDGRTITDAQIERALALAARIHNIDQEIVYLLAAHIILIDEGRAETDSGRGEETTQGRDASGFKPGADKNRDVWFQSSQYGRDAKKLMDFVPAMNMPVVF